MTASRASPPCSSSARHVESRSRAKRRRSTSAVALLTFSGASLKLERISWATFADFRLTRTKARTLAGSIASMRRAQTRYLMCASGTKSWRATSPGVGKCFWIHTNDILRERRQGMTESGWRGGQWQALRDAPGQTSGFSAGVNNWLWAYLPAHLAQLHARRQPENFAIGSRLKIMLPAAQPHHNPHAVGRSPCFSMPFEPTQPSVQLQCK